MLYVSTRRDSDYGVTDTADGVTEYYTEVQLTQLVQRGLDIYGVKLNGNKLRISIYQDLQSIMDAYNNRFIALGKKPQFSVKASRGIYGSPSVVTTDGICIVKSSGISQVSVGHIKMPDFIETVTNCSSIHEDDSYGGFSSVKYAGLVLSKNLHCLAPGMFEYSSIKGGLVLPKSLWDVSLNAFKYCDIEGDLRFLEGATEIADCGFLGCHITGNVYLPDSMRRIEISAFEDCHIAGNLYLPGTLDMIASQAFKGCDVDGRVLFSTPPKKHWEVDVDTDAWWGFRCGNYGEGVKEFFKIDKRHGLW